MLELQNPAGSSSTIAAGGSASSQDRRVASRQHLKVAAAPLVPVTASHNGADSRSRIEVWVRNR